MNRAHVQRLLGRVGLREVEEAEGQMAQFCRFGTQQQRSHLRPRAVAADEEVGGLGGAVCEGSGHGVGGGVVDVGEVFAVLHQVFLQRCLEYLSSGVPSPPGVTRLSIAGWDWQGRSLTCTSMPSARNVLNFFLDTLTGLSPGIRNINSPVLPLSHGMESSTPSVASK